MRSNKPNLCIIGHMLGRNPGYVTSQGQIVADLFSSEGYTVISASSKLNRGFRLADVVRTIVLNRSKIDLLIVEVFSGLSLIMADLASYLAERMNIPTIFVLHGGNLPDFTRRHCRWTMRVFKRAETLVAPSGYLAREIGKFKFQVKVIPNAIDIETYPLRIRRRVSPKLIWMRSFHPVYNPEMAIKAFASIKNRHPEATLVMAGVDKGLEGKMKCLARDSGFNGSIRFPGFLGSEEKAKEFLEADIYLNTNRVDNMPVSIIEACAMGLPVVATDVGGIADLLSQRKNGLLVEDNNADQMSEAVSELINNSALAEELSRNGRQLAENSSWKSVLKQWEGLFDEILENQDRASNI